MRIDMRTLSIVIAIAVLGCAPKEPLVADGSSAAAFERSIERMSSDLALEEKEQLVAAVMTLRLSKVVSFSVLDGQEKLRNADTPQFYKELDGMTREEILAFVPKPWHKVILR